MRTLRDEFEHRGYVVVRGLLSFSEADRYRAAIQELSGIHDRDYGDRVFACPDGITQNRQFWPLIDNPRLLEVTRALLGPTARYTQHSDIHVNRAGRAASPMEFGGWHRDCACREFNVGPDWDESVGPYRVTRVAIYLQTYAESRSSLGVVPGSHRFEQKLLGNDRRVWTRVLAAEYRAKRALWQMGLAGEPNYYHPWFQHRTSAVRWPIFSRPAEPVWVKTEPGDAVIFNQRLYHSPSAIVGPKYALYLSYSPEDEHARNHLRYYRYHRSDLSYSPIPEELAQRLRENDLFMETPEPRTVEGATLLARSVAR